MMSAVATEFTDNWKLVGAWLYCTNAPLGTVKVTSVWAEGEDRRAVRSDDAMPKTAGYWAIAFETAVSSIKRLLPGGSDEYTTLMFPLNSSVLKTLNVASPAGRQQYKTTQ